MKTNKVINGVTPIGVAMYPKLTEPDYKFNTAGVYSVKLQLTEEEAEPIITEIKRVIQDAYDEACEKAVSKLEKSKIKLVEDTPCKEILDDDAEPTGYYALNCKMTASGTSRKTGKEWTRKPAIFDAKGSVINITPDFQIWSGSKLRVAYELVPFSTTLGIGCSCRLTAVQVIELVSGSNKTAEGYGFSKEAGGYESVKQSENSSVEPANSFEDNSCEEEEEENEGDY